MANDALLPGGILSLTGTAADRLTAAGNGDAALLYLALLRAGGSHEQAGRALKWDSSRLAAADTALVGMGLAEKRAAPAPAPAAMELPEEPPEYTSADIAKELEDKASSFPGLVGEVQRRLGKILSTADLKILFTIYDFFALPAEVICLLVSHCVEEMERKYGQGHKPRMTQLRKEAALWRRLGLDTAESAEEYLKRQSSLRTREGGILPLVGVRGRTAVDGERKYIAEWVDMGFPDDAIRLAYEKTLLKKQNMNWPYMNSILRSWHQKGLHAVAEIRAKDSGYTGAPKTGAPAPVPDGQRVAGDVAWMKEFLARQKQEREV